MDVIRIIVRTKADMATLVEKYRASVEKAEKKLLKDGSLSHFDSYWLEKDRKSLDYYESLLAKNRDVYYMHQGKVVDIQMSVIE